MNSYFQRNHPPDPEFALPQGDYRVVSCVEDSAPAVEPISLDEARLHLRVDTNDEDQLVLGLITAARSFVESATGRAFIDRAFTCTYDGFPRRIIHLPRSRATVVNSVKYIDENDVEQTVDPSIYSVDLRTEPSRLFLKFAQRWPWIIQRPSVVRVSFRAGETTAAAVDRRDVVAIKLVLGHLYENRESTIVGTNAITLPMGIKAFIGQRQVPPFV